jgi:lipopolysaccharide transport system ATP-binding protein
MSDIVIKAENLGKKYTIGHLAAQTGRGRYTALRDVLAQNARAAWNRTRDLLQGKPVIQGDTLEEVWALKDINFEVRRGEAVGIIGRNGAGKSTLLKILSRITEPTAGRVTIKGRVASLLEVGTGFHPELTGRENIYLNGAILGMTQREIKRKFDEIVAFAEVERYLDTPVKRYSSGMYVRLAFAVAAHLEPEILVVDEVLAVGDAEFQRKCLGKMGDVAREGRTVLFVSHNMPAVQRLCQTGIVLANGQNVFSGQISEVVGQYLASAASQYDAEASVTLADVPQGPSDDFKFLSVEIQDSSGARLSRPSLGQEFQLKLVFRTARSHRDLVVGLAIHSADDIPLFATHNNDYGQTYNLLPGAYSVSVHISPNYLRERQYTVSLGAISSGVLVAHVARALIVTVDSVVHDGRINFDDRTGALFIPMLWTTPSRL